MRLYCVLVTLALLVASASLALAGDVVAMPTGNPLAPNTAEINYIYWDTEAINTPAGTVRDFINIGEVFVGITDWLELDYLYVAPQGWDRVANQDHVDELNAYFTVVKERPGKPSLILGATNITGSAWLPSTQRPDPAYGDDRLSPFAVSACNVLMPEGPPTWKDPLVRLHLGYGTRWHESRFFGAAQVLLDPKYGFGIFNYQGQPAYLAAYMPYPNLELHAGWDHGDPVYHLGYFFSW
jgi:hypothetical protein